jgi:hypothetical protein
LEYTILVSGVEVPLCTIVPELNDGGEEVMAIVAVLSNLERGLIIISMIATTNGIVLFSDISRNAQEMIEKESVEL